MLSEITLSYLHVRRQLWLRVEAGKTVRRLGELLGLGDESTDPGVCLNHVYLFIYFFHVLALRPVASSLASLCLFAPLQDGSNDNAHFIELQRGSLGPWHVVSAHVCLALNIASSGWRGTSEGGEKGGNLGRLQRLCHWTC